MPNRLSRRRHLGLLLALTALLAAGPSLAQTALDSAQQKCVNGLNKGGARVNKAQNRESFRCWQRFQKGQESSAELCWLDDPRDKVFKAAQKVFDQEPKLCGGATTPPFAYTSGFIVTSAGREQSLFFLEDLFGAEPNGAALLGSSDPDVGRCQQEAIKGGHQLEEALLKSANATKKTYLKGTKQVPAVTDAAMLAQMIGSAVGSDTKLQQRAVKLAERIDKRCGDLAGSTLATAVPGCGFTSASAVAGCVARAARCRGCNKLAQMDDLPVDCDFLDDFAANTSCFAGPTPTGTPGLTPTFGPTPTVGPTPTLGPTPTFMLTPASRAATRPN